MTGRRELMLAAGAFQTLLLIGCGTKRRPRVVIVGAGGAGLSAAVASAEAGAETLLLEKQEHVGGNTRMSGGFFAAVDPVRQEPLGIRDSLELFERQIVESGGGNSDPALARILARGAGEMLDLLQNRGMRFKNEIVEIYGAHWPRCHKPVMPNGEGYVQTLFSEARRLGAEVKTGVKVTGIIRSGNRASGVICEENGKIRRVSADAVVLASGGFAANAEMVTRYDARLSGLTNDNTPGSTGEMLEAAHETFGAELTGMSDIQCLPGCPPNRSSRVRLHNDVSRFIFVNGKGERFIREDGRRDVLRDAVLALPGRTAFSIADAETLRSFDILMQKETVLGVETGDAWRGETPEELARSMGLPPGNLRRTIEEYNRGVRKKKDVFGKAPAVLTHELKTPPFWGCFAAMTLHYTMGGLKINERAEVIGPGGAAVPGLYAAGEVSGGIHGVNRMGANGINDALVFGRIAGKEAAKFAGV